MDSHMMNSKLKRVILNAIYKGIKDPIVILFLIYLTGLGFLFLIALR